MTIRQNDLCDLTANILHQVCYDFETESCLLPVTTENLHYRSAIRRDENGTGHSSKGILVEKSEGIYGCNGVRPKRLQIFEVFAQAMLR